MSKSRGNAIFLTDSREEIERKLKKAKGDPQKIHMEDTGNPRECVPCVYLEEFAPDKAKEVNKAYAEGKMGGAEVKAVLLDVLDDYLAPIRARRAEYEAKPKVVEEILAAGNEKARAKAEATMKQVRQLVFGDKYVG